MATINAYKMDGLGNDFIIIDRRKNHIELSKDKIIELGKRSNIGFDQINYIEKEIENSFPIKIFNSDGGEVEACGNGSRCIAYLLGKKNNSKSIKIKTNNRTLNAGFKVGDDRDLAIKVVSGNVASIQNEVGEEIRLGSKLTTDGTAKYLVKIINSASEKGLLPYAYDAVDTSLQYNLGTSTLKWNEVHGVAFKGTADEANLLQVGSAYRAASAIWTDASHNDTVAVRDSSGNIVANEFTGVASRARYADLAEKYTTGETELPAGTAVAVGSDDCCEVVPAKSSHICIGVVSTDPAYMMNSEAEGQYIGLKGRVPVRVKGAVKKGQAVYAWEDGVCGTIQTTALVGVALESNDSDEEKLVECVLKT